MKVLVVSPEVESRQLVRLAVGGLEARLGVPVEFVEAGNAEQGARAVRRVRPDVVVAEEIASRAGAFALARDLRGAAEPYSGVIVILLERRQDAWLAEWSGADAWFVEPTDPFELADRLVGLASAEVRTYGGA